jgi:hypothetical protein
MGLLKTIGNKAAAAFGSGQAQGRLESGELANQLRKEYDIWLGKTGDPVGAESIKEFLKSQGLPTAAAEKAMGAPPKPGMLGKAAGAVKDIAKAGVQGAKDATAEKPKTPAGQADVKKEPTLSPPAAPATEPPAQIVGKGGSKFDQQTGKPFTSQADADAQDDEREAYAKAQQEPAAKPAAKPADTKPNFTQGNYKVTTNAPTGGIPTTGMRPKLEPASKEEPKPAAATDDPAKKQADLKAQLKAGGGLAKQSGSGFKQGMIKGNMRLGAGRGGVTMSHVPQGSMIAENFTKQQLDDIFLAAAQEASKLGVKPNTKVSLMKAAKTGYEQGKANMGNIISGTDQEQGGEEADSSSNPLLQKYLSSAGRAGKDVVADIPENIMNQLLKLNANQKQTLLKALG